MIVSRSCLLLEDDCCDNAKLRVKTRAHWRGVVRGSRREGLVTVREGHFLPLCARVWGGSAGIIPRHDSAQWSGRHSPQTDCQQEVVHVRTSPSYIQTSSNVAFWIFESLKSCFIERAKTVRDQTLVDRLRRSSKLCARNFWHILTSVSRWCSLVLQLLLQFISVFKWTRFRKLYTSNH